VVTWTQTENPFSIYDSSATVTNLSATLNGQDYDVLEHPVMPFSGLSVSDTPHTLLDGNVGGAWWYSVGNNHHGRNPGLLNHSAALSELYICQPKE
jgi:hypothetical protein